MHIRKCNESSTHINNSKLKHQTPLCLLTFRISIICCSTFSNFIIFCGSFSLFQLKSAFRSVYLMNECYWVFELVFTPDLCQCKNPSSASRGFDSRWVFVRMMYSFQYSSIRIQLAIDLLADSIFQCGKTENMMIDLLDRRFLFCSISMRWIWLVTI